MSEIDDLREENERLNLMVGYGVDAKKERDAAEARVVVLEETLEEIARHGRNSISCCKPCSDDAAAALKAARKETT